MKLKSIIASVCLLLAFFGLWYYWMLSTQLGPFLLVKNVPPKSSSSSSYQAVPAASDAMLSSDEDLTVIYNRVPKTGSTSFVNLAYDLCKKNRFHVLHVNISANMHVLSVPNQLSFVHNVTTWSAMKPALYHGHMAYLDFNQRSRGASRPPLYINIIRRPLDRLISYYYFLRYGDNYRPNLQRRKSGDKVTFDECVHQQQPDCDPKLMWLQVPFFCGHHAECWEPGSEWALNEAKHNLVNQYLLVGVTERMQDFVALLEQTLPRMFNGSLSLYMNSSKSHLRQTSFKLEPNDTTIGRIQTNKIWRMEEEFYEFALAQFEFQQRKLYVSGKTLQTFRYEKVRPKIMH